MPYKETDINLVVRELTYNTYCHADSLCHTQTVIAAPQECMQGSMEYNARVHNPINVAYFN